LLLSGERVGRAEVRIFEAFLVVGGARHDGGRCPKPERDEHDETPAKGVSRTREGCRLHDDVDSGSPRTKRRAQAAQTRAVVLERVA